MTSERIGDGALDESATSLSTVEYSTPAFNQFNQTVVTSDNEHYDNFGNKCNKINDLRE
jgi:hypothetical protein